MHNSEEKRPLCELTTWSETLLQMNNGHENIRKRFIDIAAKESPSKTFQLVEPMAINYGFDPKEANRVARAARWLAIIRRDYGQEEFDRVTTGRN